VGLGEAVPAERLELASDLLDDRAIVSERDGLLDVRFSN